MAEREGIKADLLDAVSRVAPGSPLREALDNILKARTGALIVIGDQPDVLAWTDGGFPVDAVANPQTLYELSKLDGALVLDRDMKRVVRANVQLVPDPSLPTDETGIKHRAAQRLARQAGVMVIAVSRRRHLITVYRGQHRYVVQDVSVILARVGQALSTLDRYRAIMNEAMAFLTRLEFDSAVTVRDVVAAIGRAEMVLGLAAEMDLHIRELGAEGRLARMQMRELVNGAHREMLLLLSDYQQDPDADLEGIHAAITGSRDPGDLLPDPMATARALGLGTSPDLMDRPVVARGRRVLRRIPRLPAAIVDNLVSALGRLPAIVAADKEQLDRIEGIGTARARAVHEGLIRVKEEANLFRAP